MILVPVCFDSFASAKFEMILLEKKITLTFDCEEETDDLTADEVRLSQNSYDLADEA